MKRIIAVFAAVLTLCSFCACAQLSADEYPVTLSVYTINKRPESIICLSDSAADILIACGYADRICARSDECDQPEIADIPSVGPKSSPSVNKIADIRPDLIFADRSLNDDDFREISSKGITTLTMMPAKDDASLKRLYENICSASDGRVTGKANGAEKADSVLSTIRGIEELIPDNDFAITACYLYDLDGNAAENDSAEGKLLSHAKLLNICGKTNGPADVMERIGLSDPDYIFCESGLGVKLLSDLRYTGLKAVREHKVYEISSSLMQRQGSSMTDVLSYLTDLIYPELCLHKGIKQEYLKISSTQDISQPANKNEASKSEESKTETSKSEESKAETSKSEESKAETSKSEESKTEMSKSEESKAETSKSEESKAETSKSEESKTETSKSEESKVETSKSEESKAETSKSEESNTPAVPADYSLDIYDGMSYGFGESSGNIVLIQNRLAYLGYLNAVSTGYYGDSTYEAFYAFEQNNGIAPDGFAGTSDLRLLFSSNAKMAGT